MNTQTLYGIQKVGNENPILMLTKDEYETIIKAFEFTERIYDLDSNTISVKDETSGYLSELTVRHIIKVY